MVAHKHTEVVSRTPTRTRLKVSIKRRNPQEMARIANAIKADPAVHDVQTNLQTGSIVVHHKPYSNTVENISATLGDLGIILGKVAGVELPVAQGKSDIAESLTDAVADLNQRVGSATDGVIDLRFLIPLGLSGLAIHQLLRNGWQIEAAPWYVLAYYAFDSFIKLHYTQEPSKTQQWYSAAKN